MLSSVENSGFSKVRAAEKSVRSMDSGVVIWEREHKVWPGWFHVPQVFEGRLALVGDTGVMDVDLADGAIVLDQPWPEFDRSARPPF